MNNSIKNTVTRLFDPFKFDLVELTSERVMPSASSETTKEKVIDLSENTVNIIQPQAEIATKRTIIPLPYENEDGYEECDYKKEISSSNVDENNRNKYLIDLSEKISDLDYTLEINGVPTFPRGDIQGVKAKAKQGKTHVILCLMTAMLKGEFLSIKSRLTKPKICYFATEEHLRSLHKLTKKVHQLCGWDIDSNNEVFKVYTLRSQNPKERSEYIEECIWEDEPDVVFIDGIRDLLYDFNNIQESNELVTSLLRISEECDCAIVNVLHTNKGYSDSNMRGHLGTELLNKCSDVFEVEKKDNVFCIKETDCRNISTGEWSFSLDDDGLPQRAIIVTKKEKRGNRKEEIFTIILTDSEPLTYTQLRAKYMEISNFKVDASNKHIIEMTDKGFLIKTNDGKYQLS